MSMPSGSALLKRIALEQRRVLVPLLVVFVVAVLAYAFGVYPLSQRVANIEQSSRQAQNDLVAARREFDQANGTLTGKDRAAQELRTFYASVLPRGLTGARRLTTLRLQQLARDADLDLGQLSASDEGPNADSTLRRLGLQMDLAGSYANMRGFIHQLEIAPEFVIIDNVSIAEGADEGTLVVNMELSTYYRDAAFSDGAIKEPAR
jgi:Tfp pilus assembly protein PilO